MAAVRQQVLNWLYSVLTSEYKDVNRTYNDVGQTLAQHPSLAPKTDVYTYENGVPVLLVNLTGTLPVLFRGTIYRFPISIWIPQRYPAEPPMIYVTPTEGMMIRPGQHVDPQGKIYHPYLVGWAQFSDKSNIVDFLAILREVFAKEPPVISRQQQSAPLSQQASVPPPIPPLPPGITRPPSGSPSTDNRAQAQAPLPPPKPDHNAQQYTSEPPSRRESRGPPLPPLPPQSSQGGRYAPPPPNAQPHAPQRSSTLRYDNGPPLPLQPQRQQSFREPPYSPVSPINSPENPYQRQPQYTQSYQQSQPPPSFNPSSHQHLSQQPPSYVQQQSYQSQPSQRQQDPRQAQGRPPQRVPPPDLLDAPLELPIPSDSSTNLPAPPVPPNPEKDMLLHNLGQALYSQRQHTRSQTSSSLPGLESQHKAMLTALTKMQAEIQALESLNGVLTTNTNILHNSLREADSVIESSQHRTAPNVDELLVAPTVVGNQLYELVSEERSLGDALFILGRAVERGRISPAVFTKMTRSLAREWYLKKALVKKIGRGMGLATYQ